jgi:pilus assembly protein CpaB
MGPQQQAAAPMVQTTEVLAATRDLPTGTILKETDMKWIGWSADSDTSQFYLKSKDDMNRLSGAVLRDGMRSGEPFLTGHVVQPHDHGFLAAVLLPGKRAMAVTLSPSADVAGFIFPGDHVDVILAHSFMHKEGTDSTERRVSETVLSDVRVLALDQKSDSMSTDPKIAQLATLEVSPQQAERLALIADIVGPTGSTHGSLSLVLRSLAVEDQTPVLGTTSNAGNFDTAITTPPVLGSGLTPSPKNESTATWDSDVIPPYPDLHPNNTTLEKVHVMRGSRDASDTSFERHE